MATRYHKEKTSHPLPLSLIPIGAYVANMIIPTIRPSASLFIFPFLARPTPSGTLTLRLANRSGQGPPSLLTDVDRRGDGMPARSAAKFTLPWL